MTNSTSYAPTVAFFGATGGCALACLAHALEAGYKCNALARNPSKLRSLLDARQPPVKQDNLTIIEGNVKDTSCVSKVLVTGEAQTLVDIVVSGIGAAPIFKPNPLKPRMEDPHVCEDAITTILSSLRSLPGSIKPLVVVVSTTGISSTGRDIPLPLVPLYHGFSALVIAHKDKKLMENLLIDEMKKDETERAVGGFVVVRASLLINGPRKGTGKVRVGTEAMDGTGKPAVGWLISREDVGGWIFDEIVSKTVEERKKWVGKMLSITY